MTQNKGLVLDLVDYCEKLEKAGKILPCGYENKIAHYCIHLSIDGCITKIESLASEEKPGIVIQTTFANSTKGNIRIPEIRGKYLFGMEFDKDKKTIVIKKNKNGFLELHDKLMEETLKALGDEDDPNKVDSPVVNAYRRFVEKWNPEKWMNNPVFEPFLETNTAQKVLSLNYIICVDDPECSFLHEDPALKKRWDEVIFKQRLLEKSNYNGISQQDGKTLVPIASVHNQITGMWGGSGITFACNNFEAAVSYGLLDANTCGTSVYDMEKYTRALNYLAASGSKHNFKEGNSVFVFWSMDGSERAEEIYSGLLNQYNMDEAMEEKIRKLFECVHCGILDRDRLDLLLGEVANSDFRILELDVGTKGRIIVKNYSYSTFSNIVENVVKFQESLQIGSKKTIRSYKNIRNVLFPDIANANNVLNKEEYMLREIRRSAFYDGYASFNIAQRALLRLSVERNFFSSRFYIQVGILKSWLMKNTKNECEVLTEMLNEDNTNAGYLCGRLLAAVDSLQYVTADPKPNKGLITTRIASVSMYPADAFVQILHYKEYYLARAKNKGTKIYYDKLINSILDKFDNGIPKKLNDRDRSFFFVGLAQQKTALFSAKKVSDSDTEETADDADTAIA